MWKKLFEILNGDVSFEWLIIMRKYIVMQPALAVEIRLHRRQKGFSSKIHLAVNECGLPVKFIVKKRTRADCKEAINLIKNLDAKLLSADKAYDTNEILSYLARRNIKSVIFPKRNRLEQRDYKGFRVLKQRDSSLIVNFIALDILSRILSLLLSVGAVSPTDTLKRSMLSLLPFMFVVSLCICHSLKFFSCRHYLIWIAFT